MPEFLKLLPRYDAISQFMEAVLPNLEIKRERINTAVALGRVLATPIAAPHPLPPFPRSTVDGYAVHAKGTFGASPGLPAYLSLIGEVDMGRTADLNPEPTQAVLIHTGGMIPQGSDAVVMIEDTQLVRDDEVEIFKPVAPGDNILMQGEDVNRGDTVFESGMKLRPQEIGGLMALGIFEVDVAVRPRVGIISTGNEVIPPHQEALPGQIRDINSYTLSALVTQAGGEAVQHGIVEDALDKLKEAAQKAHAQDDIVIITAGSSVSVHDMTSIVINSLGTPGVLVHGVAVKPGKPTILAVANGVPVIGLPGNPVSALVIAGLFVSPLIHAYLGLEVPRIGMQVKAKLSTNLNSIAGREDYIPVRLEQTVDGFVAEPIFGRSNLIFTLIRAIGMIRIPAEVTGLEAGSDVTVELFPV
jgi:molybdopterin molybdotransferase